MNLTRMFIRGKATSLAFEFQRSKHKISQYDTDKTK